MIQEELIEKVEAAILPYFPTDSNCTNDVRSAAEAALSVLQPQLGRRRGERRVKPCSYMDAAPYFRTRGDTGRTAGSDRRTPRIVTDNSKAAALLQVRVRELERQLDEAVLLHDAAVEAAHRNDDEALWDAIAAYDAVG
jgi:hypothetical protein